ncbi:threonine aldolase family protein [Shimia abyssi]|uniref:L-threonine aldolase n=1 Tax=Shimia abyssi TaxID=1662395 RepID=A0A2P8F7I1_9RHOB|nr:beta-eliminating lyase-related protein [Shimia abyssi]PSL17670.1 L-threonine aldolase [Shimia abyssi]
MFFASDNSGPALPLVMAALADANTGYVMGYGADPIMNEVQAQIRETFDAPEAAVYLVSTGTTANALALATLTSPWETIFCSRVAHIQEDECNAPEFYTGGAKLTLVGDGDKVSPVALTAAIEAEENRGVHGPQRGPLSITQVTERGTIYTLDEIRTLTAIAKAHDMPVHLDGARFANAIEALGCSPADMTWKAGVDAVSFGGTKNGCLGVEAVIFFDPKHSWEFELRRKRGGHLFSKHRYLSAQMNAYLKGDLWRRAANTANARAARLVAGLKEVSAVSFAHEPQANMVFASMPRAKHKSLFEAGAVYHIWDGSLEGDDPNALVTARFVCDWSISEEQIDQFIALAQSTN